MIHQFTSKFILSDGEIKSLDINFSEKTIRLIIAVRDIKKTETVVELNLNEFTVVDIFDDADTTYYSDIVLTTLDNDLIYLSLDPHGNSGLPDDEDNFVIIFKTFDYKII